MGRGFNPHIVRTLAVLNEDRGVHSTGLFNSRGDYFKVAEKARDFLKRKETTDFLDHAAANCWAICGHTRAASRGAHTTQNAHPFRYGTVVGSHNGVVDAPFKYDVDSMYIFDLLSEANPGAYQKALGEVAGWYALTWIDMRNHSLYFLNWDANLHLYHDQENKVWYYSSDANHLEAATGRDSTHYLKPEGHVVRWNKDSKGPKGCRYFTGKKREFKGTRTYRNGTWFDEGGITYPYGGKAKQYGREVNFTGEVRKFFKDGPWFGLSDDDRWVKLSNQTILNNKYPNAKAEETYVYEYPKALWAELPIISLDHRDKEGKLTSDTVIITPSQLRKSSPEEKVLGPGPLVSEWTDTELAEVRAELKKITLSDMTQDQIAALDLLDDEVQRRRNALEDRELAEWAARKQLQDDPQVLLSDLPGNPDDSFLGSGPTRPRFSVR